MKAGRAPSRALIRRAQRDRRVPRQLVGAQPRHKDTARRRSPGQREHNEACALPSYSLPYKCCSGNRPAGSWAVLLASRLHTPEARDHHTRATRPASTARVSPAQPWVQAPNTSALARHGDSLCQRRRQSSRNSLHHHDADSHWQFRPRHTSTHQDIITISNSSSPHWANNTPCRVHVPGAFLTTPGAVHIRGSANLAARHSRMLHWWRDSDRLGHFKHGQLEHDQLHQHKP